MTTTLTNAALAAGLAVLTPGLAHAACADRDSLTDKLTENYGEGLAAGGLRTEEQVLEIWASPDTGTWTVLVTNTEGVACIMASGTDWHQQKPDLALAGTPM